MALRSLDQFPFFHFIAKDDHCHNLLIQQSYFAKRPGLYTLELWCEAITAGEVCRPWRGCRGQGQRHSGDGAAHELVGRCDIDNILNAGRGGILGE